MSPEEDDIAWIKRELEDLSKRAKGPSDFGAVLIERLDAAYEDRAAAQQIEDQIRKLNKTSWARRAFGLPVSQTSQDLVSAAFLSAMEASGVLTKNDKRVAVNYSLLEFSNCGRLLVHLPRPEAYRRAKIILAAVAFASVIALVLAWDVFSSGLVGIAICWTMGSLLGWIGRATHDSAWGRENIARQLHAKHRWLVIADAQFPASVT